MKTETRARVRAQTTRSFSLSAASSVIESLLSHRGRVFFVWRLLVLIASVRSLQRPDPNVHLPFPHSRGANGERIGFVDQSSPEIWLALYVVHLGNSLGCLRVHRRTGLARGAAQTAGITCKGTNTDDDDVERLSEQSDMRNQMHTATTFRHDYTKCTRNSHTSHVK